MTQQPKWKFTKNLGDKNPVEHGGFFIFTDETGVYAPEVLKIVLSEDNPSVTLYRFEIPKLKMVTTDQTTYLIPDRYDPAWPHPVETYNEWFHPSLQHVADFIGQYVGDLRMAFCSDDLTIRGLAYKAVGDCFGYPNLDTSPVRMSTEQFQRLYAEEIEACKRQ